MKKRILLFTVLSMSIFGSKAQIQESNLYWVGHSLISHTDQNHPSSHNLINAFEALSTAGGKTHSYYNHTVPGAPIGWNWGANPSAWSNVQSVIDPLLNTSNPLYGEQDVMVVTEGVNLESSYNFWSSGFYARKFFLAGRAANPSMRFFLYESWHHFNASDLTFSAEYGPQASFDWYQYMTDVRSVWEDILEESSDPALTPNDPGYSYQGPGSDPGVGSDILNVNIIPTGQVLLQVLNRLQNNLPGDDWSFTGGVNGITLTPEDFFQNPLANFPADLTTPIHAGDPIDDIHPSAVLVYLNALVHYAVIYQENPQFLPTLNNVPANIADIFKDVVWDVVTNDSLTGVTDDSSSLSEIDSEDSFEVFPNPSSDRIYIQTTLDVSSPIEVLNLGGEVLMKSESDMREMDISSLPNGVYLVRLGTSVERIVKL